VVSTQSGGWNLGVCVRQCVRARVCVCQTRVRVCASVSVCLCVPHACAFVYVCVRLCVYVCMCVRACMRVCVYCVYVCFKFGQYDIYQGCTTRGPDPAPNMFYPALGICKKIQEISTE